MNIIIHHRTDGEGKFEKCPPVKKKVVCHYIGGRVKDSSGDVWPVRMGSDGNLHTVQEPNYQLYV